MAKSKASIATNNYIDLHCHPSIKPFGKSFNRNPVGKNSKNKRHLRSIWRYDPPSLVDKLLNYLFSLSKYSQSNFSSLAKGGVDIVCVSLYPLEKWFFRNKIKNELISDIVANFATGVGDKRVDYIQGINNYFSDLTLIYDYYRKLDGQIIKLPEGKFRYKLVRNFHEIKAVKEEEEEVNSVKFIGTICVILSIEGLHVLNDDLSKPPTLSQLLKNLKLIKSWEFRPFFITIAHHFYNHICGHAESLTGFVRKKVDQSEGINEGFNKVGLKIVDSLLNNTDHKRIHIDIKHMSVKSRQDYYTHLDSAYKSEDIPIIISHGALNGWKSFDDRSSENFRTTHKLNPVDINFFDEEIIRLVKSGGIMGLQLDERRIANKKTLKATKKSTKRHKIMHYRSELLWNQIEHMVELLDAMAMPAWNHMAIGSDYDGIIDPLNGFWSAEELPYLADFLERHAHNYLQNKKFNYPENTIKADLVVEKIMTKNAYHFIKQYFK